MYNHITDNLTWFVPVKSLWEGKTDLETEIFHCFFSLPKMYKFCIESHISGIYVLNVSRGSH